MVGNVVVKARSASTIVETGNIESSTIVSSASSPLARLWADRWNAVDSSAMRRARQRRVRPASVSVGRYARRSNNGNPICASRFWTP